MNREALLKLHDELTLEARKLMKKKNHDYAGAGGEAPFANFTRCEAMGITSTERGFLVRMVDKISRLSSYFESKELAVEDESLRDTILDVLNYAVLLYAYTQDTESGTVSNDRNS